jgi:hypothetical protein
MFAFVVALVIATAARHHPSPRRVELWFAVYILIRVLVELVNSIQLARPGLYTAAVQPLYPLACYGAARLVVYSRRTLRLFFIAVALPAAPSVVIALAQVAGVSSVSNWVISVTDSQALLSEVSRNLLNRASGLVGHWTGFGAYLCGILAMLMTIYAVDRTSRPRSWLVIALIGLVLVGVISTLTFAVIGAACAIVVLSLRRLRDLQRVAVTCSLVLLLSAPVLVPFVSARVRQEYVGTSRTTVQAAGVLPETLAFRLSVWGSQTVPAILERPLIGWGQGVYIQLGTWSDGPEPIVWSSAESQWFEELMTGGVTELLALVALLIVAYREIGARAGSLGRPGRVLIGAMVLVGTTVPCFTDVGLPVPLWAMTGALLSALSA